MTIEKWQPIETAPMDGTDVLLAWPSGRVTVSRWVHTETYRYGVKKSEDKYWDTPWVSLSLTDKSFPTHWMPLPPLPDVA